MLEEDNQTVTETPVATEGQTQPTETPTESILDGAEKLPSWKDSLPDDLKSAASLGTINSIEDLAKSYVNAQSTIGKRIENMTDEERLKYFPPQGRPETIDGYELSIPEGLEVKQELQDWFKQKSHDLNLPAEAATTLFKDYLEMTSETVREQSQLAEIKAQENVAELKRDFGPAYDERVAMANRALTQFGGDAAIEAIQQAGLQSNPAIVKMLAEAGKSLSEGKLVDSGNKGKFGVTSAEAGAKIAELRQDRDFMKAYTSPMDPGHGAAKQRMSDLYKIKSNSA